MNAPLRVAIWAWMCGWGALATQAGTLSGTVRNATRGTAATQLEVVLLELQGGMQAIATTRTDSQGRFQFSHPAIGTTPVLVRVQHQNVNY
ncbi:MAG: carboxypeptidase-like regulatory domain-containing protein, partial [Firmicutes bacterium]|nr:carboxypeptidase-like regulatory domain-containing protein [Bacillota bacterium]